MQKEIQNASGNRRQPGGLNREFSDPPSHCIKNLQLSFNKYPTTRQLSSFSLDKNKLKK